MENELLNEIIEDVFSTMPVFHKKIKVISNQILNKDISRAHIGLMFVLEGKENISMTFLGQLLSVSKPNITTLVDKLVELKYVERILDSKDRRLIYIKLTKKGIKFVSECKQNFKENFKKRLSKLKHEDLFLLKNTLHNMKKLMEIF